MTADSRKHLNFQEFNHPRATAPSRPALARARPSLPHAESVDSRHVLLLCPRGDQLWVRLSRARSPSRPSGRTRAPEVLLSSLISDRTKRIGLTSWPLAGGGEAGTHLHHEVRKRRPKVRAVGRSLRARAARASRAHAPRLRLRATGRAAGHGRHLARRLGHVDVVAARAEALHCDLPAGRAGAERGRSSAVSAGRCTLFPKFYFGIPQVLCRAGCTHGRAFWGGAGDLVRHVRPPHRKHCLTLA